MRDLWLEFREGFAWLLIGWAVLILPAGRSETSDDFLRALMTVRRPK